MRVILIRSTGVMPDPPVEKMANALLSNGYEVTILAWDRYNHYSKKRSQKQLANHNVDIIHFGIPAKYSGGIKSNLKAMLSFQIHIAQWLIQHHREYDIVHAFDFDTGFVAKFCCRLYGKKLVYHILDYYSDSHFSQGSLFGKLVEPLEIRVINSADTTIICTEKRKEQINKASPKKLYVICNTPDSELQPNESFMLQSNSHRAKIAYVGILAGGRLLKEIVETVAQMDNVEMHIGGFGLYEEWMQEAAEKYENIFYYGKLQYANTLALENQCDIMTAIYDPSFRNHMYSAPNKFYESLMLGKPIIMVNNTGHDEEILLNDIGVLAEYNEDGIRSAILELERRRDNWPAMSQRAKKLYETTFSWNIMEQRIKKIYEEL